MSSPSGSGVEPISHNPVVLALEDDLNTPLALSALFGIARKLRHTDPGEKRFRLRHELVAALSLLGLDLESDGLEIRRHGINAAHDAVVADMVAQRDAARRRKCFVGMTTMGDNGMSVLDIINKKAAIRVQTVYAATSSFRS
ncbi:DALR domain-containing protein [Acetobacter sp. DmW_136]|uniref:DALR domain-containing protein n=1 Tax=Acetobacter sp. DmW_136 TaxID=2591091 RepID=UPI0018784827|nr:DALR domain-containing protein [Acetobacter sp. DmW_136]